MSTEGAAGVFLGIVVLVLGSVALSASALFLLRQGPEPPASTLPPAVETLAATAEAGVVSTGSTPTPSPTATQALARTSTPSPTPVATETPPDDVDYVIVSGDALELIAAEFGVPPATIIERNNLVPPYTLEVGQVLVIPGGDAQP